MEIFQCSEGASLFVKPQDYLNKGIDMELTQYLLKNSEVLNTMTIYTKALYAKEELYKKLLMYDKGSKSCLIKLNWSAMKFSAT